MTGAPRDAGLDPSPDVVVVGAGAAGLATAIFARRFNRSLRIVLLDGARKPGAKILVSGGSRCNVTNSTVSDRDFWGGRRTVVRRILRTFSAADAVEFFRGLGVTLHEEADGKLFPDTNRSRDVLDALLREADAVGVTLLSGHRVTDVTRASDVFVVTTPDCVFRAPRIVLATGGRSLPKTGSDGAGYAFAQHLGHTIVATTPGLTPLLLDNAESFHRALAGVSHEASLSLWLDGAVAIRLRGALLWTHFGVSGPVAMNLSRHWLRAQQERRGIEVTANFSPDESFDQLNARVHAELLRSPRSSIHRWMSTFVPASLATALCSSSNVDARTTLAHLERDDRRRIVRALVEWPLPVTGTRGYAFAEVTAGGVSLDEVDPSTLESRVCPGLYLVGEMLDVDGRIGGFNFQWAWSSGFVAGCALARS